MTVVSRWPKGGWEGGICPTVVDLRKRIIGCWLYYQTPVAFATGDVRAVEVFEQGNGVLAGNAGPFLELAHLKPLGLAGRQELPQAVERGAVKDQVLADADQPFLAQEDFEQGAGAADLDAGLGEHFGDRGDGQRSLFEGAFDGGACLLFVILEDDAVVAGADGLAFDNERAGGGEQGVHEQRRRGGHFAAAEILAGDSGRERIILVKLRDGLDEAVAGRVEPGAIHVPGIRQSDHRGAPGGRGDGGLPQTGACDQVREGDAEPGLAHQQGDARGGVGGRQDFEASGKSCGGLPCGRRADVQDDAAADGDDWGEPADDEAVAGKQQGGIAQQEPYERAGAGWEDGQAAREAHFGLNLGRAGMKMDRCAMLEGLRGREQMKAAGHLIHGAKAAGLREHIAALELGRFDIRQVEGGALAGDGAARGNAVDLYAAHTQLTATGIDLDHLFGLDGAGNQGSGDDGSETFDGENAVDGKAKKAGGVFFRDGGADDGEGASQIVEAGAGDGTDGDDGRAFEERTGHQLFGFEFDQAEHVGIHQVGLGEDDDAARDGEEAADVEMLAGLGLDGLVGGNDEEDQVDGGNAGQHVLDEALMAGDVHEAEAEGRGDLEMGETEVDGDAAALLFLEAVGVDTGEGLDQGGLAVVDVAGGSDDDELHVACYSVEVLALPLLALVAGSIVYCLLTVVAAVRYRGARRAKVENPPPLSILKPLAGADDGLEENLRSFFEQSYPAFEILFAVRSPLDAAIPVVERLQERYPRVRSRLLVTGEPPYSNAKVYSLHRMLALARNDVVVMSDSDVRVAPDLLSAIAAEFQDEKVGLATCPYRAVPGRSFWSTLEAVGLNTEFMAGVLVARLLVGMKFALGPTIAARRKALADIGGFDAVKDYLAEGFGMGKLVGAKGYRVILSSSVIEHRIGAQSFKENLEHRLRWCRSTRRSRPWGYIGEIFTHTLPLGLVMVAAHRAWWPWFAAAVAMRAAAA